MAVRKHINTKPCENTRYHTTISPNKVCAGCTVTYMLKENYAQMLHVIEPSLHRIQCSKKTTQHTHAITQHYQSPPQVIKQIRSFCWKCWVCAKRRRCTDISARVAFCAGTHQLNAIIIRASNLILVVLLQIFANSCAILSDGVCFPCIECAWGISLIQLHSMFVVPTDERRNTERSSSSALSVLLLNACDYKPSQKKNYMHFWVLFGEGVRTVKETQLQSNA